MKTWFSHLKNLLGNPPTVTDEVGKIETILTNVGIDDGPFTMEELRSGNELA